MPSPAFRPDILKLLGWENWDPLRDEAMANLARKRRIWAENAEARAASLEQEIPPPISNGAINARGDDDNAESRHWDQEDLGLRALYGDQDDVDEAHEELSVKDPDDSNDEGSDEEDSEDDGDDDDDEGDEDEDGSSEEDDGGDKKTQLRK
ncbi:hypothetical protein MRS44_002402 [Fusarium solani]|uniref:uncharacterized protein n=1 Tax=Fusarium solani TaxID=169388 RepID=UPI0032C469BF|nr:hypothetical protein MRS44_002402 [Fusarium solani]